MLSIIVGTLSIVGGVLWSGIVLLVGIAGNDLDYWRMMWGLLAVVIGVCIIIFR